MLEANALGLVDPQLRRLERRVQHHLSAGAGEGDVEAAFTSLSGERAKVQGSETHAEPIHVDAAADALTAECDWSARNLSCGGLDHGHLPHRPDHHRSGTGLRRGVGLAIAGLVVVIRVLLIPLFVRQIKAARDMQLLSPELQALQAKYKGRADPASHEAMSRETMELYRKHGRNPFASCLPVLLQSPIFFACSGC